jgi:pilus assembly protein CpaE
MGVKRQVPALGIVIVAKTMDPALLLDAMRAGVNEFVTDPITQEAVSRAVQHVVGQRAVAVDTGQVFAFVGAKGGVGTTTVAVNVATVLGGASAPGRSLFVDLHQASGDAAVFLGVEPRFSIADALDNTHRLDQTFMHGLVMPVAPGLDLLASSERAVPSHGDAAKIRTVMEFAATAYRYTIVDLPRSDSTSLDALDNATTVVIVANQELATVRNAAKMASSLRQRYGRERVMVVVSRSDRQADIGHAEVERAVGSEVAFTFASDYRAALQALHKGRPIALDNHNELAGSLKRFAFRLAGLDKKSAAERPAGLLGLFGGSRRS